MKVTRVTDHVVFAIENKRDATFMVNLFNNATLCNFMRERLGDQSSDIPARVRQVSRAISRNHLNWQGAADRAWSHRELREIFE